MSNNLLSYNRFRSASAWILLFVGIILYLIGYGYAPANSFWSNTLIKIADVLVIGVIIGYLSNAARFLGVFKQDLEDVVLGEKFIGKRNDLVQVWERLSKFLMKEKFHAISKELLSVIRDNYLPIEAPIYYNDFHIIYEVSWKERELSLINVEETYTFEIITESDNKFELPMTTWLDIDGLEKGQYSVVIKSFKVNNVEVEPTCSEKNENGTYEYSCHTTLQGKKKYDVVQKRIKTYSQIKDNDISFKARYIINNLVVELKYPDDIDVNFIQRGTTKSFKPIHEMRGLIIKKYKGIILPQQGFVFILNKKN